MHFIDFKSREILFNCIFVGVLLFKAPGPGDMKICECSPELCLLRWIRKLRDSNFKRVLTVGKLTGFNKRVREIN